MFLFGFKIIELYDNNKCYLGTSYSSGTVVHIFSFASV